MVLKQRTLTVLSMLLAVALTQVYALGRSDDDSNSGALVRGVVVNGDTRTSISSALVFLDCMSVAKGKKCPSRLSARPDANGVFTFEGVQEGQYLIVAHAPGYVMPGGVPVPTITVKHDVTPETMEVQLVQLGNLNGYVENNANALPRSTTVKAYLQLQEAGRNVINLYRTVTPAKDGHFNLPEVEPGMYLVSVAVDDERGTGKSEYFYPNASSISDGDPIAVRPGATISGLRLQLGRPTTHRIAGSIALAPRKEGERRVLITCDDVRSASKVSGPSAIKQDGTFSIEGIAPGTYMIRAIEITFAEQTGSNGEKTGNVRLLDQVEVSIQQSDVVEVKLRDIPPLTVHGRVNAGSKVLQHDTKVNIALFPMGNAPRFVPKRTALVNAAGEFEVSGCAPLQYGVSVEPNSEFYIERITSSGGDVLATPIDLSAGSPKDLDVYVEAPPGRVIGKVRSSQEKASANSETVEDWPATTVLLFASSWNARWGLPAVRQVPATKGTFEIVGLAPGEYYAVAVPQGPGAALSSVELLERVRPFATKVVVERGSSTDVGLEALTKTAFEAMGVTPHSAR